ncbi:hypothetical protein BsWGS_00690 [Bradybaena similaris]
MQNSFISLVTKAVTKWKLKDSTDKEEKKGIAKLSYYDAVSSPDLRSSSRASQDKTSLMKNSIKDELSAFFTETSFTALTQIYKANSIWKRVVWIVLVIAMLAWMVVQCYWLFEKYYKYPIEVKMDMKVSSSLEFPSVTICNLNPIIQEKVFYKPYLPLKKYVDPDIYDALFQETITNWQFMGICDNSSYKCSNGQCISSLWICDGYNDCMSGEDEVNCTDYVCPISSWKCTNTPKCIHILSRCNGYPGDCNVNTTEDEDNCQNNTCNEIYFRCNSGMCIPKYFLCDNYKDCDNDEDNCPASTTAAYPANETTLPTTGTTNSPPSTTPTTTPTSASTTQDGQTSAQSSTTADTPRRRREAPDGPWTRAARNDSLRHSLIQRGMRRDQNGTWQSDAGADSSTRYKEINALWEASRESKTREEFVKELYDSYIAFQKSKMTKRQKRSSDNGNADSSEHYEGHHHRMKREARTTEAPKNSSVTVDWRAILLNSSFNKWDMLDNPSMAINFYEERDEEYEASMTYAYITAKLDPLVVEQSGQLKVDMIAACRFNGYQCSPANFTYFHSYKYGNCYTFNSKFANSTELYTRFPGPEYGLRLELFLDQQNYVANLATEAGFRVLVHRKGTMPFPEDEGISIMPGRSTSIGMRQVSFTRLPPPHGVCSDTSQTTNYYEKYMGTEYTKLACLKSCYQDLILKNCNCSVPLYYVLENTTICNMTDLITEICVSLVYVYQGESLEKCDKMCPIPCNDTRYELSVSMAIWPSQSYQSFLQLKLGQTNVKYMETNDSESEFTKLQIYFQDLIYEHVEQQKAYESMNLISDLGGQLGLWLGLSAITIGEICSFLFGVGRSLSYKCWGNKTMPIQDDLTPITTIQPATLQEMYEDLCPEAAKYMPPDKKSSPVADSTYA